MTFAFPREQTHLVLIDTARCNVEDPHAFIKHKVMTWKQLHARVETALIIWGGRDVAFH